MTVSIQLVPEQVKEEVYDKMSPRYSKIYKKSLEPIFVFNHETLWKILGAWLLINQENILNCWKI